MIPMSAVIASGALCLTMTGSGVDPANLSKTAVSLRNNAPHTIHKHTHAPHSSKRTVASVTAMAELNSVLADGDPLRDFSVKHTYECKLTAYGPGFASTGKHLGDPGYGVTASGRIALPQHTVAVDPNLIPLGTLVYIDGIGYRVAEDVGGAIKGQHIDLYFPSDGDALLFGVKRNVKVFVFAQEHEPLPAKQTWSYPEN